VVAAATLGSGSAAAQPTLTPPSKLVGRRGVKPKQPGTAVFLSVSSTVVSYILVASASPASFVGIAGVIVGPSVGHWYAGRGNGGGILLRTTASLILAASIVNVLSRGSYECWMASQQTCAEQQEEYERDERNTAIMLFGSLGVLAASSVWDISTAGRSARRWNEAHGVTLAPTIMPASGGRAPGLVIAGHF
jgi:hypothetical protein